MENDHFSVKNIGEAPHWNTIHEDYCLYNYSFEDTGIHPIHFKWGEVSDLKIGHIDSVVECAFKLNLAQFGMDGHEIPVMNFLNDKFYWLFYQLDERNRIIRMEGRSDYQGITKFENDVEHLIETSHCDYEEESSTAEYKGQFLKITRNENEQPLKRLTQEDVDEYMSMQEPGHELEPEDPMYYFIAYDEDDKAIPQDDQYEMQEVYDPASWEHENYFGSVPFRNQNGFEIPFYDGKEMLFAGQFTDSMFRGYDVYSYIFYDEETRVVAIFQQMT